VGSTPDRRAKTIEEFAAGKHEVAHAGAIAGS
jgi:hypothetical protein